MRTRIPVLLLAACVLQGCGRASADAGDARPDAQPLHTAMRELTNVIVYDIFSPPQASRVYAYASIAAYETLRQGDSAYRTLAGQLNGLKPVPAPQPGIQYYFPLAGVHAFMKVGTALTFSRSRMDSLRTALNERVRRGIPRAVFDSSVAYGDRVAQHILAWSKEDNYLQTRGMPKYTVTPGGGRWVPTPPAYMDAVEPNWARIRPFVMDSSSQFRPPPPFPFDTTRNSPFFREVKEVYDVRLQLTESQRAVAAFWDCNPYVMHVRGHAM